MTKEQMEQIVKQNMQKIYRHCVRRLGNATEAEDVSSDIIVELLRSYSRIENDEAVYGYIWSVADNLCKNYWRKYAKYDHQEIPNDYTGICMVTPEDDFLHKQDITLLRRELSMLSEKYRRIMIEYYMKNKSCEEIARQMNMSVTNVKQYLFEGRKKVREGMDVQREYGVYSYAPEKFSMNFWGDSSKGYWELFQRKLPGSIMLALYDKPRSIEELSMEVGVAVPYLEERIENIKEMVDKGVSLLEKTDYSFYMDDLNARRWFVLILIFWEAVHAAEDKMKTRLSFPLLANGSKGYVRVLNYKLLSDKVLSPFERGCTCGEVLKAAEERLSETEHMETLSELIERGFVRIEEEKINPCYAEISDKDYHALKEKLADEIDYIAVLAAEHRDKAGKELEKITPKGIPAVKEVGSIVSMWSMLEKIVPVVLESGYMTKGKEGQNLTTFYFRK